MGHFKCNSFIPLTYLTHYFIRHISYTFCSWFLWLFFIIISVDYALKHIITVTSFEWSQCKDLKFTTENCLLVELVLLIVFKTARVSLNRRSLSLGNPWTQNDTSNLPVPAVVCAEEETRWPCCCCWWSSVCSSLALVFHLLHHVVVTHSDEQTS